MTTIVGIFDKARDLDEAVERLAEAGIEDTVFDEAIVAEEGCNVSAPSKSYRSCGGATPRGLIGMANYRNHLQEDQIWQKSS
jgi:hypothetical protein